MIIDIDENSGFCFGVVKAISRAEQELKEKGYINSLGDIVHNKMEMDRLRMLGLNNITYDTIPTAKGDSIFIRAHGEPPSVYREIESFGYNIIDATCPVVAKLQKQIKEAYDIMCIKQGQVVLLGKRGHAEVVGLNGQIEDKAIIVESIEELLQLVDFAKPIYLLSQTTQPLSLFNKMKSIIENRSTDYIIKDTICRNVSNREPLLREFAARYDLILFIAGRDSSNGRVLFEVCRSINSNCYKIEGCDDIPEGIFEGVKTIGICGATSTPRWLMNDVAAHLG